MNLMASFSSPARARHPYCARSRSSLAVSTTYKIRIR
jgi:hypothetical protein